MCVPVSEREDSSRVIKLNPTARQELRVMPLLGCYSVSDKVRDGTGQCFQEKVSFFCEAAQVGGRQPCEVTLLATTGARHVLFDLKLAQRVPTRPCC